MPQLSPYISFDGSCAEAMRFYEQVFGARVEMMMTNGQTPNADKMPPGNEDRIAHARMRVGDTVLMAGDAMVGCHPYEGKKGFSLALSFPTGAEAGRIFAALSEGGTITMPPEKTFWAELFGMTTDRFGTPWIINGGLVDVQPPET